MEKILGLDLGTNSIGWAIRNKALSGNQLEKVGVITFNKGVGVDKTGEFSYAAQRTKKRSTRRLYQARKYRLWATLEILINEGLCPLSIKDLNKWRKYDKANGGRVYPIESLEFDQWIKLDFNGDGKPDFTSPYQLRKELSEIKSDFINEIEKHKLGRALYHIAQRRGFKSSRKGSENLAEKEVEEGNEDSSLQKSELKKNQEIVKLFDINSEIKNLEELLSTQNVKTVGALLAIQESLGNRVRLDYAQHLIRENYKDEIKYIFNFQGLGTDCTIYKLLVESSKNKNDGRIFYKRPLRSQKGLIGLCTLEQKTIIDKKTGNQIQIGKYRCPISHPAFEEFRAWSFLNNIKFKSASDPNAKFESIPLELKQEIYQDKFFRKSKSYFPFSEIIDFVKKKDKNWILNYSPKTTVSACPVSARLKDIFGDNYFEIQIPQPHKSGSFYTIEDIWHIFFSFEDQEYVVDFAVNKLKLPEAKIKQFITAWNATPVGYAMLSLNAINKINYFLKLGLIYTEAVLLAKLPELIGKEKWAKHEKLLVKEIGNLIEENRKQKQILNTVNNLISQHKNLFNNVNKDDKYNLQSTDFENIEKALTEQFGIKSWNEKPISKKNKLTEIVKDCFQAYFTLGLERKDIGGNRHFLVKSSSYIFLKADSGYYRLPKLIDTLADFLIDHSLIEENQVSKIYHPSQIEIYPPAKADKDGKIKLGSPKTGAFKNPMAMRTMHELRKLINYLLETNQIESDTRIVVEVARELNGANKRWAIETWQRQREAENQEFAKAIEQLINVESNVKANATNEEDIDKMRLWYEQNEEEFLSPIYEKKDVKGQVWQNSKKDSYKEIVAKKELVDKYRLWKEQDCQCMYTGKIISIVDLFTENKIDFEHTIPRSISFDNSLANTTVCFADYNRNVKKNQIPTALNNYSENWNSYPAIEPRLLKWKEKVERIQTQIGFWANKSKRAQEKSKKDDAIRQRHLWQFELDYWKNKLGRFTMLEVTNGFKNSQKVDTQLISKYAFHYMKTLFEKVDVQKGSITAEFRKIYGLQPSDEKKDRNSHSHHAKDAAVLTLIPVAAKRDEILEKHYKAKENKSAYHEKPYADFKAQYIFSIDDRILINNIAQNQSLTPARRVVRRRAKVVLIEGTNRPKIATGDCIRGQLHQDTFYGKIRKTKVDDNGKPLRDEKGDFVFEEKNDGFAYVIRKPITSITKLEEIVDVPLRKMIENQMNGKNLEKTLIDGVWMFNKKGEKVNKIRHVRCFASVSEPLAIKQQTHLSKHEYKNSYWAANATNSYYAIYEDGENRAFETRNLFEIAQSLDLSQTGNVLDFFNNNKIIQKGKKITSFNLKAILNSGKKVIFYLKEKSELKELSSDEISKRIYVFTNFEKDGRLNFKFHLEARRSQDIKESYSDSDIDIENPKPSLRLTSSKFKFEIEGFGFEMLPDGVIKWKF